MYSFVHIFFSGGSNGNLSVVCGSPLAAKTTMKMSTTTASSATRFLRSSSLVLSMERKATSSKKKRIIRMLQCQQLCQRNINMITESVLSV